MLHVSYTTPGASPQFSRAARGRESAAHILLAALCPLSSEIGAACMLYDCYTSFPLVSDFLFLQTLDNYSRLDDSKSLSMDRI